MKAIQYTIRNIPAPVDRYLRKRAKISGRSLNQVIIEELSANAGQPKGDSVLDSLSWFIGSNTIDDDTLHALEEDDKIQKKLTRKQWLEDDNRY